MRLRVEKRLLVPVWIQVGAIVLSLGLALLTIAGIFLLYGVNPLEAYRRIFQGAFGSGFGLSETIVKMTPLLLCAVGLALAFQARVWNIGAEGQLLAGAIAASGIALSFPEWPAFLLIPAMFIAGFLAGALCALVPALLKARWNVNEVITSLMFVYIVSELVNYLVYGPWKGADEWGFPYSSKFSPSAQLPLLGNTRIHIPTIILALALAVLAFFLMMRTRWGYEMRVTGDNPEAARSAGMNYLQTVLLVFLLSGGLAGLAGVGEVAGVHLRLRYPQGISPGYGFTAIIVAWLGQLNPLAAILSAFLIGGLLVGGDALQIALGLPMATVNVFNGIILLFILSGTVLSQYRLILEKGADR